jgi:hypothetical protein
VNNETLLAARPVGRTIPVAILGSQGRVLRPTGTVLRIELTLPVVLDGVNKKLKEIIRGALGSGVTRVFAFRKDGRTVEAGVCWPEDTKALCAIQ